jgi:hydrogenase expression/formation protein HypC
MCLAVPGRVEEVWEADGTRMGRVDFGGVHKEVCLALVPEVVPGDYAIVHVGFALARLDEDAARETLDVWRAVGDGGAP